MLGRRYADSFISARRFVHESSFVVGTGGRYFHRDDLFRVGPEAWQERGGQVVRRLRSGNARPVSRVAAHGTARIPGRNQSPSETASPFLPRSSFWALLDHFAPAISQLTPVLEPFASRRRSCRA